jgi:hypothetical protein
MTVEVYNFPSHSREATRAYGVKLDGALIGLVERYPNGSWHMGGGRLRKLGFLSYKTRKEVVDILVAAEMEEKSLEQPQVADLTA